MTSTKQDILERLRMADRPLAVHEFDLIGRSQNNIATRLSEMQRVGVVSGVKADGKAYKIWSLTPERRQVELKAAA